MDPIQYLKALRRRWFVVVLAVGVGLAAAWVTTDVADVRPAPATYTATAFLLSDQPLGASTSLDTIAALTTIGEVPKRAAHVLGSDVDPEALASSVDATSDETTGLLQITATSREPDQAKQVADTFANELVSYLGERNIEQAQALLADIDRLDQRIAKLDGEIAAAGVDVPPDLVDQRDGLRIERDFLFQEYSSLVAGASGLQGSGLEIVQLATPVAVPQTGFQAPTSRVSRLAIGGIVGLLIGAALVLVLERYDPRLRTKEAAEERYSYPVLAEIPTIRRPRRRALVAHTKPSSAPAHAFRLLAAGVIHGLAVRDGERSDAPDRSVGGTILVTSAAPSEGKSTVVANLAVTLGKMGHSTLVLSCDFGNPGLHRIFGVPDQPGLADALEETGSPVLNGAVRYTRVPLVRVVPSGIVEEDATELLSSERMHEAMREASGLADFVLVDSAPVLAASEWTHVLSSVDGVLLVARAGRTTSRSATRTAEMLTMLEAPVLGVTLNASSEQVPKYKYKYKYGHSRRRRSHRSKGGDIPTSRVPQEEGTV